jgi:hypothetical protein
MFIRAQDDSGSITLEVMARGFGQQPVYSCHMSQEIRDISEEE